MRSLALSGLALLEDSHERLSQAAQVSRAVRRIFADAGTVGRALRLFDELARDGSAGRLRKLRTAVKGE